MKMGGDITELARVITPAGDTMMLELLDRLGRQRALSEDESKLVEILVRRTTRALPRRLYRWTAKDDRILLKARHTPRGLIEAAEKLGVSENAARSRVRNLLKRNRSNDMVEG